MRKVNEQLLLSDYDNIVEKKKNGMKIIEEKAREFAAGRGYDEAKTEEFVKFVLGMENGGMTDDENRLIAILEKYIFTIEDAEPEHEEEQAPEEVTKPDEEPATFY